MPPTVRDRVDEFCDNLIARLQEAHLHQTWQCDCLDATAGGWYTTVRFNTPVCRDVRVINLYFGSRGKGTAEEYRYGPARVEFNWRKQSPKEVAKLIVTYTKGNSDAPDNPRP